MRVSDEDMPGDGCDEAGGTGDPAVRAGATERGTPGATARTERYAVDLGDVDETQVAVVGGKGAHLGALSAVEGARAPEGFCVT